MSEDVAHGAQESGVVVAVNRALVHDELAVNILVVDHLTVAVNLVGVAFRAERDEHGQCAEVVDVVKDWPYAQRTHVGYDHGAVEWACVQKRLRQPAEVVHHAQYHKDEAQQKARQLAQCFGHVLSAVAAGVGLYLVYLLLHLAVDVIYGVGRLKDYFYRGLGRVKRERALGYHYDLYVVARIDPATDDKAVDARHHGKGTHIGRDDEVQKANALVSGHAHAAQMAVNIGDLEALLVLVAAVTAPGHYVRHELVERREASHEPALFAVAEAALVFTHWFPSDHI